MNLERWRIKVELQFQSFCFDTNDASLSAKRLDTIRRGFFLN